MPAQWWKLPMLCVSSWNVGMCVSDVQHLKAVGTHFSFDLLSTIQDIFPFVVFDYWLDPVIIFDIFPGCILLVTFRLVTSFRSFFFSFLKKSCLNTIVHFFSLMSSLFVLNECNCYTSSIVYFHFLAISSVCWLFRPFCQCHIVSCVDLHTGYMFV